MHNADKVHTVDLFCGAGGLTKGLCQAGIDVRLGVDIDPACEYPYVANNSARFMRMGVEDLDAEVLASVFPDDGVRLIAGCAPCQTFSKYNQKARSDDGRWWLLRHFSRLILECLPELVTMENVPGLASQDVFRSFTSDLRNANYEVACATVSCAEYGVPQNRCRLVLLASRLGPIRLLSPRELRARPRSVREAIGHLPPIGAGEACRSDRLHQSSTLSPANLRRIRASRPGGTWRDWESSIVATCHKKVTGRGYASVYGRMNWDEPAPTITTQFYGFGSGRFGHPEQDRAISLREGAVLQGFPKSYVFVRENGPVHTKTIGRLIGNAVPVKLGWVIGKSILGHVAEIGVGTSMTETTTVRANRKLA